MPSLDNLNHVTIPLVEGGKVVVLDTGAVIPPEAQAMLQALHSRSVGGIFEHLKALAERGAKGFMSTYYVGYNHKSIGDCGTIIIFIEGVSMLAAKAVQDWPLYSGQESSTRYINFSKQVFRSPIKHRSASEVLEALRALYLEVLEVLVPELARKHPRDESEKEAVYEKAIKARAFDIARSLLPSGANTNLAWISNLRQVADKLMLLRHHPLAEVRDIAKAIEEAASVACPNSFGHKRYDATEGYNAWWMRDGYLLSSLLADLPPLSVNSDGVDRGLLWEYRSFLPARPQMTELPRQIGECGLVRCEFPLDFGSFRDVQRHRAVLQRMPLVTDTHGFEPWYLNQMPESLRDKVQEFLRKYARTTSSFDVSSEEKQYFVPMGYRLPNRLVGGLHALVYLVELRASSRVHPTLQIVAHGIAEELRQQFSDFNLVVHTDDEPGRFDVRRGNDDIVSVA
ncbi:MAG: FAD-dependent thymidylate synthase [Candidatus Pacebacteria bacterium]|jgi:thymidylate synthase ThyX|nr:hypothetical protein [bacterium]MDP6527389.1 FAD-dependent thymidylate synthase [Candidatus Paceibacterota bacterium]MDP6659516.1 FAD-dependent thymidylate synthase [Candidatus Paceibacterota bacterium]|tara:strand:+ start:35302 stop:36666 length:1365 start_codon:yes stop_codon:yes gene_type:complete